MTIGELLQLAKSNLIEDAYHAVESCLVGSNADLTGEITPALKAAVEEELVLYDYEWSDLVFVDGIKLENKIDVKQVLESVVKKLKQEGRYFQEKDNIKKMVLKEVMDLAKNKKQTLKESFTPVNMVNTTENDSVKFFKNLETGKYKITGLKSGELISVYDTQNGTSKTVSVIDVLPYGIEVDDNSGIERLAYFTVDGSEEENNLVGRLELRETKTKTSKKNLTEDKQVIANKMRGGKTQLTEGISYLNLEKGETYTWTGGAEYTNVKYIGKTSETSNVKIGSSMGKGLLFQWSDGRYFELSPNAVRKYINKKELDEAVTVPLETLEKDTDKISKVAEKTDVVITENKQNKQNKMKTKEEKIKSLTEAIQKMTGKKVLLKEYPNAIADKVVRSKHIDPLTKERYAMSKIENGPTTSELEDIDLDSLDLDDNDFGTEDTMFFDESTGSSSARRASGKPRLQEGTSLDGDTTDMIDGLIDDTIIPALSDDFSFGNKEEAQAAMNYLISELQAIDISDIFSGDWDEELEEASNATMDKMVRSKHIDQTTKDKYAKDKKRRENPYDMTGKIVDNFPFQGRMAESVKRKRIKSLTEAIQKRTGKKVVLTEKKKDVIKTLKEEITKRAKLVYYIKTGKKVTLKETAGEEETTLEDQVNLENNIDTPTLGNIMPTSIIKTIEQYVSTTLAEIDKSTTELRTIKKNIVLNSGPSDGSFETLINRIGFLLKQLERVQRYTSNTIKAGVFNKSILDKIFEQKELLNEIK